MATPVRQGLIPTCVNLTAVAPEVVGLELTAVAPEVIGLELVAAKLVAVEMPAIRPPPVCSATPGWLV